MLKYFYNLYFQYNTDDECTSTFDIGYFTTLKKAREAIKIYSTKTGFKNFDISHFHIDKKGVFFDKDVNKEEVNIYVLSCENPIDDDIYSWFVFGAFSTYEEAEQEQRKQEKKKAFKSAEFCIEEWKPDVDLEWKEGFNSFDD